MNQANVWNVRHETLLAVRDYDVVRTRRWNIGRAPLDVTWWWHPVVPAVDVDELVAERIDELQLGRNDSSRASVLVVPHSFHNVWPYLNRKRFDEFWVLKKHVTSDAAGPYPSLRAERSIRTTFRSQNLMRVSHFWPSAGLPAADYRALGSAESLTRLWAKSARARVPVEVDGGAA